MTNVISYDLGTGGIKASLFDENGVSLVNTFYPYDTFYEGALIHEQRPLDWRTGVIKSTRLLMDNCDINNSCIDGIAISGHSLGVNPIDNNGELLLEKTPIWSDARARKQAGEFFKKYCFADWYNKTGNGFPAELYPIFKIMWYRDNMPNIFQKTNKFLGTKDYLNYMLTGKILTDHSYASGSGVYNLIENKYDDELLNVAGIKKNVFPEVVDSTMVVGRLKANAASMLGLKEGIKVFCGGVDNSCMALGALCYKDGRVYTSLGTSAWIAVSQNKPILDENVKPFVFSHVVPGQYTSAVSIFSAGSSYKWIRDNICKDLCSIAEKENLEIFEIMEKEAQQSPVGANGLLFNPSLAGGSAFEPTPDIKGGYAGLVLSHNRNDMIRAGLEGVAINLSLVLDMLRNVTDVSNDMILVGGGSKSALWRQIFADTYRCNIIKSNIDQDAASLGAAGIALVGLGEWKSFANIDKAHRIESVTSPIVENVEKYRQIVPIFKQLTECYAKIGSMISK